MTTAYGIDMPSKIAGRIGRCTVAVRDAIRDELQSIAVTAGKGPRRVPAVRKGPPMRFYVYEGYRVFYELDARTRQVTVLDFGTVPAT
jgi:hypothetical protein